MLRADTTAGAAYYALMLTPGNGLIVQYRDGVRCGHQSARCSSAEPTAPLYLQITRTGTAFSASTSSDGVTWTPSPARR